MRHLLAIILKPDSVDEDPMNKQLQNQNRQIFKFKMGQPQTDCCSSKATTNRISNYLTHSPTKYYEIKDQYNSNQTKKILSLQEELLNTQRQFSRKETQWQKQRHNLLAKQEITHLEIMQYQQRVSNLGQLNKTLTEALSEGNFDQQSLQCIQNMANAILGKQIKITSFKKSNKNRSNINEQQSQKYQALEAENAKLKKQNREYVSMIEQLGDKIEQTKDKSGNSNEEIIEKYESQIRTLKAKIEKLQNEILEAHKEISMLSNQRQSLQKSFKNIKNPLEHKKSTQKFSNPHRNNHFKKQLTLNQLDCDQLTNRKYACNSSYLLLNPTSDNTDFYPHSQQSQNIFEAKRNSDTSRLKIKQKKKHQPLINYTSRNSKNQRYQRAPQNYRQSRQNYIDDNIYEHDDNEEYYGNQEEEEQLLCEVCDRVFPFSTFQEHLQQCGYRSQMQSEIQQLLLKKQKISNKIEYLKVSEQQNRGSDNYYRNQTKNKIREKVKTRIPNNYSDFSIKQYHW